ncbi:MAG: choice-of-anchor A family protein [Kiritimatiellae bacterium]|jgi:hypothetical protein|nr:choice-of-anchor A family protein [Kiritimatiellia bacterium]
MTDISARALAVMACSACALFGDEPPGTPAVPEAAGWETLATNFNALIFGDLSAAGGDCEYRLAVGGTATFTIGYSVGQPVYGLPLPVYTNAETDILIVGGDLIDGWFGVNGNIVYGGTRYGPYRWMPDGNVVTQITPVAFDASGNVSRGGGGASWAQLFPVSAPSARIWPPCPTAVSLPKVSQARGNAF